MIVNHLEKFSLVAELVLTFWRQEHGRQRRVYRKLVDWPLGPAGAEAGASGASIGARRFLTECLDYPCRHPSSARIKKGSDGDRRAADCLVTGLN